MESFQRREKMTQPITKQDGPRTYCRVLTIAGSDSGGGAGIQADLKTISAIGCYGMSVITALTAQNTRGVTGIHAVPPAFAAEQMSAVFADIGADAVKIGMLYSAELIEVVAKQLQAHGAKNIVLDPVMVAQSGDKLLQDDAIEAIKKHLMPLADVVTPNIPEAEVLLNRKIQSAEDMHQAAKALAEYGSRSILIKGGHLTENDSTDLLYLPGENRIVARDHEIETALKMAKSYISHAIRAGAEYTIGQGHGPVHHFFEFWK
jgi:hydroxymethylpyrimidine/phosphomethylpyrimidine kinase